MNREFTESDHKQALAYGHWAKNGGKNSRKVWYNGAVYESISAVGKAFRGLSSGVVRKYVLKGYTVDYEIILPYNEETFEKDFKTIKTRIVALLEGKLEDLQEKTKYGLYRVWAFRFAGDTI